jgi:hypothetical protein
MPPAKDSELARIFIEKALKAFTVYPVSVAMYAKLYRKAVFFE